MNLAVVDWGGIPDGILFPVRQRWFETKRVLLFVNNVAWRAPILKVTMPYLPQYRKDPFTVVHTQSSAVCTAVTTELSDRS